MSLMRQRGTSLDLSTEDGTYECTVLFLWNKKQPPIKNNEAEETTKGLEDIDLAVA